MMFGQWLNSQRIIKRLAKALISLGPSLFWAFAGRTYHIVENLMSWLEYNKTVIDYCVIEYAVDIHHWIPILT